MQKLPAGHGVQSLAALRLVASEYVPALHGSAAAAPGKQYEPAPHGLHVVFPLASWNLPAAQLTHKPLVTSWKLPGAHSLHAYSLFERVSSTPQLPTRTEPAAHVRRSHVAFGQASLSWPWPV